MDNGLNSTNFMGIIAANILLWIGSIMFLGLTRQRSIELSFYLPFEQREESKDSK